MAGVFVAFGGGVGQMTELVDKEVSLACVVLAGPCKCAFYELALYLVPTAGAVPRGPERNALIAEALRGDPLDATDVLRAGMLIVAKVTRQQSAPEQPSGAAGVVVGVGAPAAGGGGGALAAGGGGATRQVRFVSSPAVTVFTAQITLTAREGVSSGLQGARRFALETASVLEVGGSVTRLSSSAVAVSGSSLDKEAMGKFVLRMRQHFLKLAVVTVAEYEIEAATEEELLRTTVFVYNKTLPRIVRAAQAARQTISGDDESEQLSHAGDEGGLRIEVRSLASSAFDNLVRGSEGEEDAAAAGGAGGGAAAGR